MDEPPDSKSGVVRKFRMRPERAQALVRSIAADTGKVIIGEHAKLRMQEREISDIEVISHPADWICNGGAIAN
jgi:hypothetical protein